MNIIKTVKYYTLKRLNIIAILILGALILLPLLFFRGNGNPTIKKAKHSPKKLIDSVQ
jgi:hypothetical protein